LKVKVSTNHARLRAATFGEARIRGGAVLKDAFGDGPADGVPSFYFGLGGIDPRDLAKAAEDRDGGDEPVLLDVLAKK